MSLQMSSNDLVQTVHIKEFHPDLIDPNPKTVHTREKGFRLVMIGKPGVGKSNMIKYLLWCKKDLIPVGLAMSGSETLNHDFKKYFPSLFVYNDYDEESIEDAIKRQQLSIQHLDNEWAAIVIDDCTNRPSELNSETQHKLYKIGRHAQLFYVLSLQYSMDVDPSIRTCVDGVFIFREPNLKNRRRLHENYAGIIPDFSTFCQLLDDITTDYTALYIHNKTTSNKWEDCVYYCKAPEMDKEYPDFKFGSPDYWKFAKTRYNEEYTDPL
jgi:hypothetical protein